MQLWCRDLFRQYLRKQNFDLVCIQSNCPLEPNYIFIENIINLQENTINFIKNVNLNRSGLGKIKESVKARIIVESNQWGNQNTLLLDFDEFKDKTLFLDFIEDDSNGLQIRND